MFFNWIASAAPRKDGEIVPHTNDLRHCEQSEAIKSFKISQIIISLVILLLSNSLALANDTMATIETSGIVFTKSDKISMEDEELYISADKIKVKYKFLNDSDKDVDGIVTFPLPDVSSVTPYSIDFFGYAPTIPNTSEKIKKHDEEIKELHESNPFEFNLKINGQDKEINLETKILDWQGKDMEQCGEYCTSKFNYYWQQLFPKKSTTVVEHNYLTGVGSGTTENDKNTYCFDENFNNGLEKLDKSLSPSYQKQGTFGLWLNYNSDNIKYILQTGKNWKDGKIKHFKMILDKGKPNNLMSLCWKSGNLKKINQTQFMFEANDFVPEQDLDILIINSPK